MRDTQPYQEATIEIDDVYFSKNGRLFFDGLVENDYVKVEITDMTKILPKISGEFAYMDDEGFCNAVLDNYQNLFWHLKVNGNVIERRVVLKGFMEQLLFEEYQRNNKLNNHD